MAGGDRLRPRDVTSGPGSNAVLLSSCGLLTSYFLCLSCAECKAEADKILSSSRSWWSLTCVALAVKPESGSFPWEAMLQIPFRLFKRHSDLVT